MKTKERKKKKREPRQSIIIRESSHSSLPLLSYHPTDYIRQGEKEKEEKKKHPRDYTSIKRPNFTKGIPANT